LDIVKNFGDYVNIALFFNLSFISSPSSLSTGVKNLPDSFFSDELPEEIQAREAKEAAERKEAAKRKRKGKKRKDEEKKESNKENEAEKGEEKEAEEAEEEDEGEQIITTVGDEQTVVSVERGEETKNNC
jgi:hypothetical protein